MTSREQTRRVPRRPAAAGCHESHPGESPIPQPLHGVMLYRSIPESRRGSKTKRPSNGNEYHQVATDYDEVRSDVAESRNASLEALRSANAPDARSVVRELDEADTSEGVELPGADLSGEELTVTVIPQKEDEFTCYSCFLVRHRSQLAKEKAGHAYCADCLS